MRDKIRIELSSESRLGWEPFYAVLDLPATAQQIRDARQKARITGREDMTYQSISFLGFDPLPADQHRCPSGLVRGFRLLRRLRRDKSSSRMALRCRSSRPAP